MYNSERKKIEALIELEIKDGPRILKFETEEFAVEKNWGNVSGHCLIEAARVLALADLLGFGADLKKDCVLA